MKLILLLLIQLVCKMKSSHPIPPQILSVNSQENNNKINSFNEPVDLTYQDYQRYRILSRTKYCETYCKGCCLNNICLPESECKFLFFSIFGLLIVTIGFCSCVCSISIIVALIKLVNIAKDNKLKLPCNKQKINPEQKSETNIAIEMT